MNASEFSKMKSIIWTLCHGVLLLAVVVCPTPAQATTVIPPSFDDLVNQSDYVVRAVVKSVSCEWRSEGANRHILTKVELEVEEVIAGNPPTPLVLEMLGGKIGDLQMVVQGTPEFKVGDEDILFIHGNGIQFNPLVALGHGRYPIKHDAQTGRSYMTRSNGEILHDEQEVAKPLEENGALKAETISPASPLSPEAFVTRIKSARHPNTVSPNEK
jgi:hypothetical protein